MNIYLCLLLTGQNNHEVPDVNVDIAQNFIMPTVRQNMFLLRKILIVGIPKSTVLVIIFRVFMWPLSLMNAGPRRISHLQCFEMAYQKKTIASYIGMMDDGINFFPSDSAMTYKYKKNSRATFKIKM